MAAITEFLFRTSWLWAGDVFDRGSRRLPPSLGAAEVGRIILINFASAIPADTHRSAGNMAAYWLRCPHGPPAP